MRLAHFALAAPAWPPRWHYGPSNRPGVIAANALGSQAARGGPVPSAQHVPTLVNGTPGQRPRKRVQFRWYSYLGPVTSIRTFPKTLPCMKRTLW